MKAALSYVDGFIRERGRLIERIRRGEKLGRFIAGAGAMYLVFAAVYGLAMGSFRWAHPMFFFSDFIIEGEGTRLAGKVDSMDLKMKSVATKDVTASAELVGRAVRFNRTNPTPSYEITRAEQLGPYCRLTLKGPSMVAEAPWKFTLLAAVKVPALFLVTLVVCLPALYVLNIALGWKLRFAPTVAVLVFAMAGTSVVLAVLAPIVLFFTVLTDQYHFMMLLHVLVFALAGAYGVQTLAMGLSGLGQEDEAGRGIGRRILARFLVGRLVLVWLLLYMFVGCQMAWTLRPFVGTPYLIEFEALRPPSSNFYAGVIGSLGKLVDTRR